MDDELYEIGYRDGQGSAHAEWRFALDDVLPEDMASPLPTDVAAYVADMRQLLADFYHAGRAAFCALGLEEDWPDGFAELIEKAGDVLYPDLDRTPLD